MALAVLVGGPCPPDGGSAMVAAPDDLQLPCEGRNCTDGYAIRRDADPTAKIDMEVMPRR